jgi:hypothetical protein
MIDSGVVKTIWRAEGDDPVFGLLVRSLCNCARRVLLAKRGEEATSEDGSLFTDSNLVRWCRVDVDCLDTEGDSAEQNPSRPRIRIASDKSTSFQMGNTCSSFCRLLRCSVLRLMLLELLNTRSLN